MPELDLAAHLEPIFTPCPMQAGSLLTTIRDLQLAVGWVELRPLVLETTQSKWAVIIGRKRREDQLRAVLPLPLHTAELRPSELRAIFEALAGLSVAELPEEVPPLVESVESLRAEYRRRTGGAEGEEGGDEASPDQEGEEKEAGTFDPETIYVAIGSADSTVVYYKLSKGIRKPHDIPDE